MLSEIDRARDALHALDAGCTRDEWHKTGRAAIAAGLTIEDIDEWSATGGNYAGTRDVQAAFRTIKPEGGTGAGTLFRLAREAGWNENSKPQQRPQQAPRRAAEPPRKPAAGMSPADIWERCEPATNGHGYIEAKRAQGVPLDGLRVVPIGDPLHIAGQSMAGCLVVPAFAADSALQSLQLIPPPGAGKKLNLPGAPMAGASFAVGPPDGPAFLCEGVGAAWAVWQATGQRAIVCFGWGNVRRIAEAMHEQDASARLVVVPDSGKEKQAAEIAADVGCMVAAMPTGEANNFDANDLAQRDGLDVLEALLTNASNPPKPEPKVHPLARYVDIDAKAKPPRWVIPGFIGHGVTVIAGAHGVGKTTALLPLAMTAAGLHGGELKPRHWRHVVYITEDTEQASRILAGITGHSNSGINLEALRDRMHIVEAVRLDPSYVASVGATYREQFTRTVEGVEVLPLVVLDTKSAVLAVENENDNSEASAMMAALKQGFDSLPVWLIGHVAKANLSRNDALTSRGASAIEGDANQTLFLIREGESRYLVQGKTRFESTWPELEITSHTAQTTAPDEFGNLEPVLLRWGIAAPANQSRKETAERAAEQQRKDDEASLRQDIRDAIQLAWVAGNPLNRAGVKAKVRRKTSDVVAMVENLLNERWLYEVTVPAKDRTNNSKSAYLVNLATEEHEAILSDGALPADKLEIPASWKKQAIPVIPAPDSEAGEIDHAEQ